MIQKDVQFRLESGLEARPIAMLVQVASRFDSSVYIEAADKKVNAKSIMGMMSLGIASSSGVKIIADGEDEEVAVKEIENFLSSNQ